jgi:WD40 repeat protein
MIHRRFGLVVVLLFLTCVAPSLQTHAQQSTPTLVAIFSHDDEILGVVWRNNLVLSWSYDRTARLWDTHKGLIATMPHKDVVVNAAWNGDGTRILTVPVGSPDTLMWNTQGDLLAVLKGVFASWDRDSSHVLTLSTDGVCLWDRNGLQIAILPHQAPVRGAEWNQDETQILSWSEDNMIHLWNVDGTSIATMEQNEPVYEAIWSPDENHILSYSAATVYIWNIAGELVGTYTHDGIIGGATWHPNSLQALSWSFDNTVRIWKMANGEPVSLVHDDWVVGANWNSQGTRILTWSADSTVRVWDNDGVELARMDNTKPGHNEQLRNLGLPLTRVSDATWSYDARYILSRSNDDELCTREEWKCVFSAWLWTAEGQLIAEFPHEDYVAGAIWNKDETRVLTWSDDGTTKIWDNRGKLLTTIPYEDHRGLSVRYASWNENETQVLTWSDGHTIRLWQVGTK